MTTRVNDMTGLTRRTWTKLVITMLMAFVGWVGAGVSRAEAGDVALVNAEVLVLHATVTPGGGSIDPRIGDVPQLKKPPLSAFNTYKFVDRKTTPLNKGETVTLA